MSQTGLVQLNSCFIRLDQLVTKFSLMFTTSGWSEMCRVQLDPIRRVTDLLPRLWVLLTELNPLVFGSDHQFYQVLFRGQELPVKCNKSFSLWDSFFQQQPIVFSRKCFQRDLSRNVNYNNVRRKWMKTAAVTCYGHHGNRITCLISERQTENKPQTVVSPEVARKLMFRWVSVCLKIKKRISVDQQCFYLFN